MFPRRPGTLIGRGLAEHGWVLVKLRMENTSRLWVRRKKMKPRASSSVKSSVFQTKI